MYFDFSFVLLCADSQDFSESPEEPPSAVQETSIKRLVVGPLDVRLHSSAVHRVLKMVLCAMDHEYEPYCKPHQGQLFLTTLHSLKLFLLWLELFYACYRFLVFCFGPFFQCTENATTWQYPHHIVISLHNPSFNTAVHESRDLLDLVKEGEPNTFVSDHPCTAIHELISEMLRKETECVHV